MAVPFSGRFYRLFSGPSQKFRKRLSGAMIGPGYGAAVRLMRETSRPLSFAGAGYAKLYELQARAYR